MKNKTILFNTVNDYVYDFYKCIESDFTSYIEPKIKLINNQYYLKLISMKAQGLSTLYLVRFFSIKTDYEKTDIDKLINELKQYLFNLQELKIKAQGL